MLGTLVSAYLALFALDAFGARSVVEALPAFLVHLAPAALVLAIVALAWRWPVIGAIVFAALAAAYAFTARRLDWIVAISGPLFIVALLFAWSWWYGRSEPTMSAPR